MGGNKKEPLELHSPAALTSGSSKTGFSFQPGVVSPQLQPKRIDLSTFRFSDVDPFFVMATQKVITCYFWVQTGQLSLNESSFARSL